MLKNAKTTIITIQTFKTHSNIVAYQNERKLKHWLIETLLADVGYTAVPAESTEPTKTMENSWKNLLRSLIVHRKK